MKPIYTNFPGNRRKVPAPIDGKNVTDDWIYDFDNHVSSNIVGKRHDFGVFFKDILWKMSYIEKDNVIYVEGMHATVDDSLAFKEMLNEDMGFAHMEDLECVINIFEDAEFTIAFFFKEGN